MALELAQIDVVAALVLRLVTAMSFALRHRGYFEWLLLAALFPVKEKLVVHQAALPALQPMALSHGSGPLGVLVMRNSDLFWIAWRTRSSTAPWPLPPTGLRC